MSQWTAFFIKIQKVSLIIQLQGKKTTVALMKRDPVRTQGAAGLLYSPPRKARITSDHINITRYRRQIVSYTGAGTSLRITVTVPSAPPWQEGWNQIIFFNENYSAILRLTNSQKDLLI